LLLAALELLVRLQRHMRAGKHLVSQYTNSLLQRGVELDKFVDWGCELFRHDFNDQRFFVLELDFSLSSELHLYELGQLGSMHSELRRGNEDSNSSHFNAGSSARDMCERFE